MSCTDCIIEAAQAAVDEHRKGYHNAAGFSVDRQLLLMDRLAELLDEYAARGIAAEGGDPLGAPREAQEPDPKGRAMQRIDP